MVFFLSDGLGFGITPSDGGSEVSHNFFLRSSKLSGWSHCWGDPPDPPEAVGSGWPLFFLKKKREHRSPLQARKQAMVLQSCRTAPFVSFRSSQDSHSRTGASARWPETVAPKSHHSMSQEGGGVAPKPGIRLRSVLHRQPCIVPWCCGAPNWTPAARRASRPQPVLFRSGGAVLLLLPGATVSPEPPGCCLHCMGSSLHGR